MQFLVYRDNGGLFHWRLQGDDGEQLAVSAGTFGSAADAQRAATVVQRGAATARSEAA
jgi:uncharacterized protein YegP (UPF0339 family)